MRLVGIMSVEYVVREGSINDRNGNQRRYIGVETHA